MASPQAVQRPLHSSHRRVMSLSRLGSRGEQHWLTFGSMDQSNSPIPGELLDLVLLFMGLSYSSLGDPSLLLILDSHSELLKSLKTCTLVCRHWANQCRRYLFSGVSLQVRSHKLMATMIQYALHGSPFLVPVHTLISGINVVQTYESASFLHLVFFFASIAGKKLELFQLHLAGPVPENFPTCKLDTPHWTLPTSISTPPSLFPYTFIKLSRIHLPSFVHVAKYIDHFKLATYIHFDQLTWDDDGLRELPTRVIPESTRHASHERFALKVSGCTDNTRIALQVMSIYKHSPLHILSDGPGRERHAVVMWIQEFFDRIIESLEVKTTWAQSRSDVDINFKINKWTSRLTLHKYKLGRSQDGTTLNFCVSAFTIRLPQIRPFRRTVRGIVPLPTAHSPSLGLGRRLAGLSSRYGSEPPRVDFDPDTVKSDLRLDDLLTHIEQFSMLQAIAIIFDDYNHLLFEMAVHRPVPFNPLFAHNMYVLVCRRTWDQPFPEVARAITRYHLGEPDPDWVGINPITLSPIGLAWSNEDDIMPSLLNTP